MVEKKKWDGLAGGRNGDFVVGVTVTYHTRRRKDLHHNGRPAVLLAMYQTPDYKDGPGYIESGYIRFTDALGGSRHVRLMDIVADSSTANRKLVRQWRATCKQLRSEHSNSSLPDLPTE
jgi:hypothetical protein